VLCGYEKVVGSHSMFWDPNWWHFFRGFPKLMAWEW
jgi:hypothetical protein